MGHENMMVDHKLTWALYVLDIKKSFVTKLDLLKRSRFLPTKVLWDFYFKVILLSVKYGLVLWGACCDSDLFQSIERLHCRASRLIFNLPKDMASCDVIGYDQWPTLFLYYKLDIFTFFIKHITMASLPVSGERANMSWDGLYVGKGMKSGEGASYMYIWEEGQYTVRWLICKKRDNIWRRGLYLRRGPMSWDGLYAKRRTTSGEGACIQRGPICREMTFMPKGGQHLEKGLIFKEGECCEMANM